jgi:hypothetical protein
MSDRDGSSGLIPMTMWAGAAGLAIAIVVAGAAVILSPRPAQATMAYTAQTGLPCGKCHVNSAGGGALTDYGKAFAANGDKVPKEN